MLRFLDLALSIRLAQIGVLTSVCFALLYFGLSDGELAIIYAAMGVLSFAIT